MVEQALAREIRLADKAARNKRLDPYTLFDVVDDSYQVIADWKGLREGGAGGKLDRGDRIACSWRTGRGGLVHTDEGRRVLGDDVLEEVRARPLNDEYSFASCHNEIRLRAMRVRGGIDGVNHRRPQPSCNDIDREQGRDLRRLWCRGLESVPGDCAPRYPRGIACELSQPPTSGVLGFGTRCRFQCPRAQRQRIRGRLDRGEGFAGGEHHSQRSQHATSEHKGIIAAAAASVVSPSSPFVTISSPRVLATTAPRAIAAMPPLAGVLFGDLVSVYRLHEPEELGGMATAGLALEDLGDLVIADGLRHGQRREPPGGS